MIRLLASLLTTLIGGLFLGCVALFVGFSYYGRGLPDYKQLEVYEPAIVTRFYAGDGRLFHEYALQKRVFIPIVSIPLMVRYAFLAAEDKNFYQHTGVDFWSIARALLTNIAHISQGRRPIGASTITQQVARYFLLSDELSLDRKIKEAILAFRIDHAFTKDHILELYLNEIYLGAGSYGVGAAALHYFNKSLDDLSLSEIAFLAALPKAPNNYHPNRFPKKALARRNWVLQRMMEDGVISKEQAEAAMKEPIVLHAQDPSQSVRADHFAEEVRRDLLHRYGEEVLYKGGLVVQTTLDPRLQTIAEKTLRQGLINYDRHHGWRGPIAHISEEFLLSPLWVDSLKKVPVPPALEPWVLAVVLEVTPQAAKIGLKDGKEGVISLSEVKWARRFISCDVLGPEVKKVGDVLQKGDVIAVMPVSLRDPKEKKTEKSIFSLCQIPRVNGALVAMDPHTGRVLALVGGYSYSTSEFNRATQALRQPGSSFKTFTYLAAMEEGLKPNTIVEDAPVAIPIGYGLGVWKPKNISDRFYGPRTLRFGLEKSLNSQSVRLFQMVGIEKVAEVVEKLGVMGKMPRHFSMSLGAGETTVLKMATGYSIIMNGGKKIAPTLIDRIQDRLGRTVFKHDHRNIQMVDLQDWTQFPTLVDDRAQMIDPICSYQVVSMMEGAVHRGTARVAQKVGKPVALKTGTSNESNDTWCIGGSPDLLGAVFVGFDVPESLGKRATGGSVAAPILADFMAEALKDAPPVPFRVPAGTKLVPVDLETGMVMHEGAPNTILEAFPDVSSTEMETGMSPLLSEETSDISQRDETEKKSSLSPPSSLFY